MRLERWMMWHIFLAEPSSHIWTNYNVQGQAGLHANIYNNSIFYEEIMYKAPEVWTHFSRTIILRTHLIWATQLIGKSLQTEQLQEVVLGYIPD